MSFREKIHWVSLTAMILAFGWYFLAFPWQIASTSAGVWASAGMLVPATIGIIVVMTIFTAIAAIRSPGEVDVKEDERDRGFHLLGTHYAYYPLVVGIWINIFLIFWGVSQAQQLNMMLATLVVAELVRIGTQLYLYRRGF